MCLCVQNPVVLFSSASLVMRIWVLYLSMRGGTTAGKVSREGSHPESPLRYPLEAQSMMRGTPASVTGILRFDQTGAHWLKGCGERSRARSGDP